MKFPPKDSHPEQRLSPSGWAGISLATWGSLLCFFSAVGYTATNMCLRQLAALGVDPMWATAMKETVAVVGLGPWFLFQVFRGRRFFPSVGWIGLVVISALIAQFAGNIFQQWSFGVVGLAIAVPVIFSVSLTGSALLGWICLGETVSVRTMGSLVLLIGAIGLLSFGAIWTSPPDQAELPLSKAEPMPRLEGSPGASDRQEALGQPDYAPLLPGISMEMMLLGIGAACVAGAAFAQLGLMLRASSARGLPAPGVVLLVTGVGAGLLGPISLWRLGPSLLVQTTPQQWCYMFGAGTCNLLAFLAITTGLRWTKLLRANLLNAAQVAMGALAGIVVFGESWNWAIGAGLSFTILGLALIGSPREEMLPSSGRQKPPLPLTPTDQPAQDSSREDAPAEKMPELRDA